MRLPTPASTVRKLQKSLHVKAKTAPSFRFYSLWDKIYRDDILREAYRRCRRNRGAAGVDRETFEQVETYGVEQWLGNLQQELKAKTYQPQPLLRVWIPKSNGGQRPLGIATLRDRVVQMAVQLILQPIFEADLLPQQYGFRPGLDAKMAVRRVYFHLTQWRRQEVVDGDLSDYFTTIPHGALMKCVARRIADGSVLAMIKRWLEAPVMERLKRGYQRRTEARDSHRGPPQGAVCSPILMNIYLDRLDQFVETVLLPLYNRGDRRKRYQPYMALLNAARRRTDAGHRDEAKRLRLQAQDMPSRDPVDPNFRRLWYVRYADDTLLGFSGPRAEAEAIKGQLATFLRDMLKLELSQDETLITHARTRAARFLGYDVVTLDADDKHDHRGQRCINGALGLKVPVDVIRAKCVRYMNRGKPIHLAARLHNTDYSIVSQYQAEYRGFVQYYLLAFNVHRLWWLHRVMELSLACTLANKHKSKLSRVYRKYRTTMTTPHGTHKVLEVTVPRGAGKKPLVARFGGIELRWQKTATLNDRPKEVYSHRSEIEQRLLAQHCEVCGAEEDCEVHHIRKLADLDKPGRKGKPAWVRRMAMRKRKTLVVCRTCHEAIHYGKPKRHESVA